MTNYNPNKTVSANSNGINVFYTDSKKSHRLNYENGPLTEIQLRGSNFNGKMYQTVEVKSDSIQSKLYNDAMYGLKNYTDKQIAAMTYSQKMEIINSFEQAQSQINIWKQQLIHEKVGSFLTTIFNKSKFAKDLATYPKSISVWEKCSMTLKQLGVSKEMIEKKLIELKILPNNYYELA
jgi:hypothetical protein